MLRQQLKRRERQGQVTTVRDFKGGWNVVDNEFNMSPRYSRVLRNALRQTDGTIGPRWGTEWFASIESLGIGKIINMEYYNTYLVGVTSHGAVFAVNGQGTIFEIWNEDIAHGQAGSPHSWHHSSTPNLTFASLTPFKNKLVICNGIDKPLVVDKYLNVQYLYDLATGSNLNTPIGRYAAAAVGDDFGYFVIAGDPLNPALLHIGHADALGTFLGDAAPNDAVQFNLSSKVTNGSDIIRGIKFYRDRLVVGFDEVVIAVQVGVYNTAGTVHQPIVTDVIEGFGCVSHRTMHALVEDIFMASNHNVNYITRAKLSTSLVGEDAGELIQPEIQKALQSLSEGTLEDRVFAVNNPNEKQWMLFVPNHDEYDYTTESRGFIYTVGRPGAWAEAKYWNWRAGCATLQNNVFFASDYDIFRYGKEANPLYREYVNDQETFSDDTKFTDHTGFYPYGDDSGLPITWAWELPWADFDKRMSLKKSTFFSVDASGAGQFIAKMFIDDTYNDFTDPGEDHTDGYLFDDDLGYVREDSLLLPALSQNFVGGGQGGYGVDGYGQNQFGGGHRSNLPKNYRWPARFKIGKLRFEGDTMENLRIAAFSISYTNGSLRR